MGVQISKAFPRRWGRQSGITVSFFSFTRTATYSSLEAAIASRLIVEQQADEGLAVVNLLGGDQAEGFGQRHTEDLDVFVGFWRGGAFADIARKVDLHPLAEKARAGEVFPQQRPAFGAVAGLFDHLAFGGGERRFAGIDAAGWKLVEKLSCGMAGLPLHDDVGVCRVL